MKNRQKKEASTLTTEKFSEDPGKDTLIKELLFRTGFEPNGKMTKRERADLRKERKRIIECNRWGELSIHDLEMFLGITSASKSARAEEKLLDEVLNNYQVHCNLAGGKVIIRAHRNGDRSCVWYITSPIGVPECNNCPNNHQPSVLSAQA